MAKDDTYDQVCWMDINLEKNMGPYVPIFLPFEFMPATSLQFSLPHTMCATKV